MIWVTKWRLIAKVAMHLVINVWDTRDINHTHNHHRLPRNNHTQKLT
jgi:hypothetical protein